MGDSGRELQLCNAPMPDISAGYGGTIFVAEDVALARGQLVQGCSPICIAHLECCMEEESA